LHEIQKNGSASHCKNKKHTSLHMQHPDSKKQRREGNCEVLENPLQPILCFFFSKPLQGYLVDTTSVLQTTIKGWWWLSKKTTTLWGYYGRRS